MSARTQDEILARIEAIGDDFFGFRREALIYSLDFDHAKPFLQPDATAEDWAKVYEGDRLEEEARGYYTFALRKIENHRGISANRSVEKLTEFAWLLGWDDVVEMMGGTPYEQYGAPIVKLFGEALGESWPDDEAMRRMAEGLPCTDDCTAGCGR